MDCQNIKCSMLNQQCQSSGTGDVGQTDLNSFLSAVFHNDFRFYKGPGMYALETLDGRVQP